MWRGMELYCGKDLVTASRHPCSGPARHREADRRRRWSHSPIGPADDAGLDRYSGGSRLGIAPAIRCLVPSRRPAHRAVRHSPCRWIGVAPSVGFAPPVINQANEPIAVQPTATKDAESSTYLKECCTSQASGRVWPLPRRTLGCHRAASSSCPDGTTRSTGEEVERFSLDPAAPPHVVCLCRLLLVYRFRSDATGALLLQRPCRPLKSAGRCKRLSLR